MRHGYDIRASRVVRRTLSVLVAGLVLCLPTHQALAISSEGLVAMASIQALLIAIGRTNWAMQYAAQNPLDKPRREAVQTAIRAMPAAVIAVAAEFKAGNLHDKDLPLVQAMMGGFVDVNAADGYKRFLNNPSADLIPRVGNTFPQQFMGSSNTGFAITRSVVFDDDVAKGVSRSPASVAESQGPSQVKLGAMKGIGEKQEQALDSLRITFDDNKKTATSQTELPRANYRLKVKPKYWQMSPYVLLIESLILKEAHAEESECKSGKCGGGSGGGGQSGGGGEAAAQILTAMAGIIAAMAPLAAAAADKDIAETQAKAQIEMTNISANTSKAIAEQNANLALQQTAAAERINKANQDGVSMRLDKQLAQLDSARQDATAREREDRAEKKRLTDLTIALTQKQADDNFKLGQIAVSNKLMADGLTTGFGAAKNSGAGLASQTLANNGAANTNPSGATATGAATSTSGQAFRGSNTIGALAAAQSGAGLSVSLGGTPASSRAFTSGGSAGRGAGITIADSKGTISAGPARLLSSLSGQVPSVPGADKAGLALSSPGLLKNASLAPGSQRGMIFGKPSAAATNAARALAAQLKSAGHRGVRGSTPTQLLALNSDAADVARPALGRNVQGDGGRRVRVIQDGDNQVPEILFMAIPPLAMPEGHGSSPY